MSMKRFQEVFPNYRPQEDTAGLVKQLEISRVAANEDYSLIEIWMTCPCLADHETFRGLEQDLPRQLFPNKRVRVRIHETFRLSGHFTPERLFAACKEGIYHELGQKSLFALRIMKEASISFPSENIMEITAYDTSLNRYVIRDLKDFLKDEFFGARCGVPVEVRFKYLPYELPEPSEIPSEPLPVRGPAAQEEEAFLIDDTGRQASQAGEEGKQAAAAKYAAEPKETKKNASAKKDAGQNGRKTDGNQYGRQGNGSRGGRNGGFGERRNSGYGGSRNYGKPKNPDVIYGRDFTDEVTPMNELDNVMGEVKIRGEIFELEVKFIEKSNSTLFLFSVTDFTDSISARIFINDPGDDQYRIDQLNTLKAELKVGKTIRILGDLGRSKNDGELCIDRVRGIRKSDGLEKLTREDHAKLKRVELHCHTKMSDMDGVTSVKDIIKQAQKWGWDAIAITDHGNLQAFPDAWHTVAGKQKDFPKIIYGVEGYLVDDLQDLVLNPEDRTIDSPFVVFDIETTGFSTVKNQIIEIGAVKVEEGKITDRFSTFVNPHVPIPYKIEQLTSINDAMVMDAPDISEVIPKFLAFCEGCGVVAHNASFDVPFVQRKAGDLGIRWNPTVMDTMTLAQVLLPHMAHYKLQQVAKAVGVVLDHHHRAVDDAECTAGIFLAFVRMLRERGLVTLEQVCTLGRSNPEMVRKTRPYHVIILAKNETGRVNLYRLVSDSHLKYFGGNAPKIPKSELQKYREGLIVGSACEAGELFQAVARSKSDEEIARLVNFYDFLEIQPIGNNMFMIDSDEYAAESEEDLKDLNRRIVRLGEQFGKPVAATCDVHFLNPEDEVYRRIIMAGKQFKDADRQPPLFLRTTEEMLQEFSYLGPEKCEEVVITNTRKIADMVEQLSPVRPDKCPPVIQDSDKKLTDSCYEKAYQQYGKPLPDIVKKRLDKELSSIIKNGFAVMYIIAQELVLHSNSEGYLVGSRGSVGSSFVAYTAGITEVNPLPPHYFCPNCQYSDFDSEIPKSYAGTAGCDMPDAVCPRCGKPLKKDGFDIPFETFLGFKGDKEPDIDLNFSGENQSSAHAYTEVIFGKGQTFRAGTVGTLADKTAFGYVKNYFEEHGERKRKCEISRIVQGCVGVRRTTGQHPGGIVVLPKGESIYSFTPIQHPANDMTTPIITTHFEYHAIDHNLLKLDILGHQDPTMIRMLQDLTGIDPVRDIPLDSKEVMSLFRDTSALGVTPDDILGCRLGALGIPEFGTDFAMNMLIKAQPKGFSDLVRIAGLAHGTDVWQGNAEKLIDEGLATIGTAICTRDDIMLGLIQWGMDPQESFKIMESVRKGKGLNADWEAHMKEHNVPDWYIWSCKKIKYMFPKAHAAAYVMMAWRIGYCKIFYPLAYYASYFTIRATGFSYEIMCQGKQRLETFLAELRKRNDAGNRENPLSPKEADMLKDGRICQEMYARGFSFVPIDLYKAQATRFTIVDDHRLMPALTSIDGLGESVAVQIVEAAKQGEFISKDDFKTRSGTGQTTCDLLDRLGILGKLPESNQLSIFDMI